MDNKTERQGGTWRERKTERERESAVTVRSSFMSPTKILPRSHSEQIAVLQDSEEGFAKCPWGVQNRFNKDISPEWSWLESWKEAGEAVTLDISGWGTSKKKKSLNSIRMQWRCVEPTVPLKKIKFTNVFGQVRTLKPLYQCDCFNKVISSTVYCMLLAHRWHSFQQLLITPSCWRQGVPVSFLCCIYAHVATLHLLNKWL